MPEHAIASGLVLPESVEDFRKAFRSIDSGAQSGGAKLRMRDAAGLPHWIDMKFSAIPAENGSRSAVISFLDITENHEKELAYERYTQAIRDGSAPDGPLAFFEADLTGNVLEKCGGALLPAGFPGPGADRDTAIAYIASMSGSQEVRERIRTILSREHLLTAFSDGQHAISESVCVQKPDGADLYDGLELQMVQAPYTGHIKLYTIARDMTEEKKAELAIRRRAEHDGMTGLYNKTTAETLISERLKQHPGSACALLVADLDNLKAVNDTYGHSVGDDAICLFGQALRALFRQNDIVGRIGGDEFAAFLDCCGSEAWLNSLMLVFADRLSVIRFGTASECRLRGSVGIAYCASGAASYDELFKMADKALYHVKRSGKGDYAFYTPDMEDLFFSFKSKGHSEAAASSILSLTPREAASLIRELGRVFDVVRLIDAEKAHVVTISQSGDPLDTGHSCFALLNKSGRCENCTSYRALKSKARLSKFEVLNGKIYQVVSQYVELSGAPYVLEIISVPS